MNDSFFDHDGREISGLIWLVAALIGFAAIFVISIGMSQHVNRLTRRDWASPIPAARPVPSSNPTAIPAPIAAPIPAARPH